MGRRQRLNRRRWVWRSLAVEQAAPRRLLPQEETLAVDGARAEGEAAPAEEEMPMEEAELTEETLVVEDAGIEANHSFSHVIQRMWTGARLAPGLFGWQTE